LEVVYYSHASADYQRALIPEKHLMEATTQARQREITLASLALVHAKRPEIQYYNELLVQYRGKQERRIQGVVPDNMVVICEEPIIGLSSYPVELQPATPYWMLDYVSRSNHRKDYERNFVCYEQDLKVPYCLLFYPDDRDLTLFRLREGRYQSVLPNNRERMAIPKLELEIGILGEWVRFWFRGDLLLLPAELESARETADQRAKMAEAQAAKDRQALESMQAELARLQAQLAKDA